MLVKGLDFALLEQNRAKVAAEQGVDDDETLEQAFLEARSGEGTKETSGTANAPTSGKKRTREDLVRELKNKRMKNGITEDTTAQVSKLPIDDIVKLEEAKKAGKFKPIGFKPIGEDKPNKKVKKVKVGADMTSRKAKAKATPAPTVEPQQSLPLPSTSSQSTDAPKPAAIASKPPPEPVDPDFDIFAGAGDYTGVDLGSSSDSEGEIQDSSEKKQTRTSRSPSPQSIPPAPKKWFDDVDEARPLRRSSSRPRSKSRSRPADSKEEGEVEMDSPRSRSPSRHSPSRHGHGKPEDEEDEEGDVPTRLQPLSSSAVPSIREILAMDEQAEKEKKRKAKKEKKGRKLDTEGKVERDYQRYVPPLNRGVWNEGLVC